MNRILILIAAAIPMLLMSGSDNGERVVRVATEAADRQAEQNREMASVNRAAAAAHERLAELQQGVQVERTQLSAGWNDLEEERRQIASERRTESFLAAASDDLGIAVVAALSLAVVWIILSRTANDSEGDQAVLEVLLTELTMNESSPFGLIDRLPPPGDAKQLPANAESLETTNHKEQDP